MLKTFLLSLFTLLNLASNAEIIPVSTPEELRKADNKAKPGDIIILKNGDWNNIIISLNCKGTKSQPITFKAETPGKVFIKGLSKLRVGGDYIIVDGLYFTDGYAGRDAVIDFRVNRNNIASNCRVTNTVIKSFNNPKRLEENYWVSFSGKNNRLDHCTFIDKKNIGVLLAVLLDTENDRENFHSIDHNYFGYRLPLASNGGEIIRVGVSQHATFNSNTQITDNYFEHCDGETEIVSIKSCANVVKNNLFKECQGSVVLRHGDNNTVENNIFLGNNKEGTGGVRIINHGQWIVNNLFYKCRGMGFRSPMALMNGIVNSPANRYVQVTDAVIWGNSFFECSPVSFGEGSDTERTLPPRKVIFANNIFFNSKDQKIYNAYDDISGIRFRNNGVSMAVKQQMATGFIRSALPVRTAAGITLPYQPKIIPPDDSMRTAAMSRLGHQLSKTPGFADDKLLRSILDNANKDCGAQWYQALAADPAPMALKVDCKTAAEVLYQINKLTPVIINLTRTNYQFETPLEINSDITFTTKLKSKIKFSTPSESLYFIQLHGGHTLRLKGLSLDLGDIMQDAFIITDTSGSSEHSKYFQDGCRIDGWNGSFFRAVKSTVLDTISISNSSFFNSSGLLFDFTNENDRKGYYNVEKLIIKNNTFSKHRGQILSMLRGGNDESTLGPALIFEGNALQNAGMNVDDVPLIYLYGTQQSIVRNNTFVKCNPEGILIKYEDAVRANHVFSMNVVEASGKVVRNKYVN